MNWKAILLPALAVPALLLTVTSCDEAEASDKQQNAAAQNETAKPTAERVLQRSAERWAKIVAAGEDSSLWVDVYQYEDPQNKAVFKLGEFLANKENFVYDAPTEPKLLLMEDDKAYVDISALWLAGRHNLVASAEIGGSPDRVEPMEMIEIWRFVEGDWFFQGPPKRKNEFFRDNPDFLTRAQEAAAAARD